MKACSEAEACWRRGSSQARLCSDSHSAGSGKMLRCLRALVVIAMLAGTTFLMTGAAGLAEQRATGQLCNPGTATGTQTGVSTWRT